MTSRQNTGDSHWSVVCAVGAFGVLAQEAEEGGTAKPADSGKASAFRRSGPLCTADGDLIRPDGWWKWVYVGMPLTPHDMYGGNAGFRSFVTFTFDPESSATFGRRGEFLNGTQLPKELVLGGSKQAVTVTSWANSPGWKSPSRTPSDQRISRAAGLTSASAMSKSRSTRKPPRPATRVMRQVPTPTL